MKCPCASFLLLACIVIAGQASRPAQSHIVVFGVGQAREVEQEELGALRDGTVDLKDSITQLDEAAVEANEIRGKEKTFYTDTMARYSAAEDVVGSWAFSIQDRMGSFSIVTKGTERSLIQKLDGIVLEASLQFSDGWWQGIGSIIGDGSQEVVRIRRRGNKLLSNTKRPGDWYWRGTTVASQVGDVAPLEAAQCDAIFKSESKVNLVAAKRCFESSDFVHIQIPKGQHFIDESLVLKSHGTLLLQGNGDKEDVVIKCNSEHPAFELENGAELLIEGLVLDTCGAPESGAILAEGKESFSLRLQRGTRISNAVGNGICIRGSPHNSRVLFEDNSTITGSGRNGFFTEGGENNTYSFLSSAITGSAKTGFFAKGGKHSTFLLDNSTIDKSGGTGFSTAGGEKHSFSLVHSMINASGANGLFSNGGGSHTFRLTGSVISGSWRSGLKVEHGEEHSFSLANSTIHGSGGSGLSTLSGRNHTFSLSHSILLASSDQGLNVFEGENHVFTLDYCTINASKGNGLYMSSGENNSLSLASSMISGNGAAGISLDGPRNFTFSMAYSTISASGLDGILLNNRFGQDYAGEGNTFSLVHSTISESGTYGFSITEGKASNFSLVNVTISASENFGIVVDEAERCNVVLAHSTIIGSNSTGFKVDRGNRNAVTLAHSTISASGQSGLLADEGESNTFNLSNSTIIGSATYGIRAAGGNNNTFSLAYSRISASGKDGVSAYRGQKHTFTLAHSTIIDSGRDGLAAFQGGMNHTFRLVYSSISASGRDGLAASTGASGRGGISVDVEKDTYSLAYSTIIGSGNSGIRAPEAESSTFNLAYSKISASRNDCIYIGGSITMDGCTFEGCSGAAVTTTDNGKMSLMAMNTSFQDTLIGLKVNRILVTNLTNTTFRNISSIAVSVLKGFLYTTNVRVYASGAAFSVGNISWEGSKTTVIGNSMGIACTNSTRGTLATSFAFLNAVYDTYTCEGLVLDEPLPMKMRTAEELQASVFTVILIVIALTAFLPVIQDPPKDFRHCSWLLVFVSGITAALWLAIITFVLWTAYELFQREERDETRYGADAQAWGMSFMQLLVIGIIISFAAVIVAFLSRKKYTFLHSAAQTLLDSEERRKCKEALSHQRGDYSEKLREYHEAMVSYVSSATCCKTVAEGQPDFKLAQEKFEQMKKLARDSGKALDLKLHQDAQLTYREDSLRWQTLLDIESISQRCRYQGEHMIPFNKISGGDLIPIKPEELNGQVTRRLLLAASWGRSVFQKSLQNVANRLNESHHVDDLIQELSQQFPLVAQQLEKLVPDVRNLKSRRYKLLRDVQATLCGRHCNVVMGPNKTDASASRKAAQIDDEHTKNPPKDGLEWQTPAARYLVDLLRATVVFSDPVALVVFFNLLSTEFTVIRTKNKYKDALEKVGSPSILVNIEVETIFGKLITEVQLYLDKFLDLKFLAHTNYEIDRVTDLLELLAPFCH